jgi:hypothetical protein
MMVLIMELLLYGSFFCSSAHYCSLAQGMCRQAEQNHLKSRTLQQFAFGMCSQAEKSLKGSFMNDKIGISKPGKENPPFPPPPNMLSL